MKVNICGYDVSISAKYIWQDKKSKTATLEFLNYLSIVLDEAAHSYNRGGYEGSAENCRKFSDELYNFNKEHGLYGK